MRELVLLPKECRVAPLLVHKILAVYHQVECTSIERPKGGVFTPMSDWLCDRSDAEDKKGFTQRL